MGGQYALYLGAGSILSNMFGGWIYENHGGRALFRYSSVIYIVWSVVMLIDICVRKCYRCRQAADKITDKMWHVGSIYTSVDYGQYNTV